MSTVEKALEVLDLFSDLRSSIGLSQAARLLSRDKATVQRHLSALEARGFLEQDPLSRAYHLGPAVTRLAVVRDLTYPVETAVRNVAAKLVQDSGETVHVSHAQALGLSCVCIVETTLRNTRVYIDPSEVLPLHVTASGIAYLASLPADRADRLLARAFDRMTPDSGLTLNMAQSSLLKARDRGYALAEATFDYDVVGMASAVFNAAGDPCGAIAVATPITRFNDQAEARNAALLIPAAEAVSRIYGATPATARTAAE